MKVIIIGAGMAGLTFALACQRAGIDVKLYDKASRLRNIGGGVLLWPHGIRYLQWLGIADCLNAFWLPVKGCRIIGHRNQKIFSEDYATFYSLIGGEILPVDRHHLQQSLLMRLTENTLELGKKCVRVKNEDHAARVIFADGTEDTADLIIGADGIYSTVRKNIQAESSLHYTNYCWWGGIIEQKYVPHLAAHEVFIALTQSKMCIVWPIVNDRFMWYLPVKMSLTDFKKGEDGLAQLQTICKNWNDDVQQIIHAPASENNFHLAIHVLPPQTNWSSQRIILIGDAAHTLGPILGQGASQAIEDAFVLFQCLQHFADDLSTLSGYYESLRRSRYERLYELENQAASMIISDNLAALELSHAQMEQLDLVTMYQDLIPLVNETACLQLAAAIRRKGVGRGLG